MAPTPRSVARGAAKDAKKSDEVVETPAYSQENIQHNMRIIYYSRTFLSIVGGVVAGVLGLTGVTGFLCYFVIMLLASAGIAVKTKFDVFSFFDSWNRITIDGIAQGFMSFVLFWTFAYDIVHIF
ncbi:hypothetical protein CY35_11G066800 [Sphagnum magellanicum]|nr:hypothetical protein CY35_11G066800 [Sphagnum magellanicum]